MNELLPVADGPEMRRYARSLVRRHPRAMWLVVVHRSMMPRWSGGSEDPPLRKLA